MKEKGLKPRRPAFSPFLPDNLLLDRSRRYPKKEDCSPNWAKMERGMGHINHVFFLLFAVQVQLSQWLVKNVSPSWDIKPGGGKAQTDLEMLQCHLTVLLSWLLIIESHFESIELCLAFIRASKYHQILETLERPSISLMLQLKFLTSSFLPLEQRARWGFLGICGPCAASSCLAVLRQHLRRC